MKLVLRSEMKINFSSLTDLEKAIPEKFSGRALNYGQGEGQVEIANTIWGFYYYSSKYYYMQLEEGQEVAELIFELAESISNTLSKNFSTPIRLIAVGSTENEA
ncbi:MAG: hypothetical protein V4660_06165 [Pseudomonadota bacterium]